MTKSRVEQEMTFRSDFVHDPGSDVGVAAEGALKVGPRRARVLVGLGHVVGAELTARLVDLSSIINVVRQNMATEDQIRTAPRITHLNDQRKIRNLS